MESAESTTKKTGATFEETVNALGALASLEEKVAKRPVDAEFVKQLKLLSTGLFRIVVMGEIKKGKSSFINALLGVRDLVPVSSDIATSTIYKICCGEKIAYKVFFTEESKKPCVFIDKKDLAQYGTEDGNPLNKKCVEFIQVFVPSPFLKDGLVIIDTPGLGGLFKQHKRITYEYVPRADAVFMVSDSVESPIGKSELDLLEDLKKVTDQIFFVQTKAMAVDAEARQARERNNRATLERHGFDRKTLRYFVVDSHLKLDADEAKDKEDLLDSGFIPLAAFVNNEIKAKARRLLLQKAIKTAMPKILAVENLIADEGKILAADSASSRQEIADALASAEKEAESWKRDELPGIQDKIQDRLCTIKLSAMERIKKYRPMGEVQGEATQIIYQCKDQKSLSSWLREFSDTISNQMTQERYAVLSDVHSGVENLLREIGSEESARMPIQLGGNLDVNVEAVRRVVEEDRASMVKTWEKARTGLYGGMAGYGIASLVGMTLGSVIPVVGTVIGSQLGAYIAMGVGTALSFKSKSASDLKGAQQHAQSAVNQVLNSGYQALVESISKVLSDIEVQVSRALRDVVANRQDDIARHKKELQERQTVEASQLNEKRQALGQASLELKTIKQVVARVN